jgi:histone-binding protein RBBP4
MVRWDTRGSSGSKPLTPTASIEAHEAEVNALAFSPYSETLLLTASSDKVRGMVFAFGC